MKLAKQHSDKILSSFSNDSHINSASPILRSYLSIIKITRVENDNDPFQTRCLYFFGEGISSSFFSISNIFYLFSLAVTLISSVSHIPNLIQNIKKYELCSM